MSDTEVFTLIVVYFICAAIAIFIPYFVAKYRKVIRIRFIFWGCIFAGWTGLGWFVLLFLSIMWESYNDSFVCPNCQDAIVSRMASVCSGCGHEFE